MTPRPPYVLAVVCGAIELCVGCFAFSHVPQAPPAALARLLDQMGGERIPFDARTALPWPHRVVALGDSWYPVALPLWAAIVCAALGAAWLILRRRRNVAVNELGAAAAILGLSALVAAWVVSPPELVSRISSSVLVGAPVAALSAVSFAALRLVRRL